MHHGLAGAEKFHLSDVSVQSITKLRLKPFEPCNSPRPGVQEVVVRAPNICGPKLLRVTLLKHRILNWLLGFLENFCTLDLSNIQQIQLIPRREHSSAVL
jgi:hypothetical protein